MRITKNETLRKIQMSSKYIPPLEVEDQQAILFNYRASLQVILILLERVGELKEEIRLKEKGNSDLSRILEDWIIKDKKR